MKAVIEKTTMSAMSTCEGFLDLFRECEVEAAIAGLPKADEKLETYRVIEASGVFHSFGAYVEGRLVGFINVVAPVLPHFGATVAVSESFFVGKRWRKSGAGLRLLRAAEALAREIGSPALLVSAPLGGALAEVLPRIGYRETNRVFSRTFAALPACPRTVSAMSRHAVDQVRKLEAAAMERPQVELETAHQFHAGMYSRTIKVPAGVTITGALIKIATTLIVCGNAVMKGEDEAVELHGYQVMAAAAHRKLAFYAITDTWITMTFPTAAATVEEAEAEFTDETDLLMTRRAMKELA